MESRYGSNWSVLGAPVSDETAANGGRYQNFEQGSIYTKTSPGVFIVLKSLIFDKWQSLAG